MAKRKPTKSDLRHIARAIKTLDDGWNSQTALGGSVNKNRVTKARNNLINVLFSNGYELEQGTYKIIDSKRKRSLLKYV